MGKFSYKYYKVGATLKTVNILLFVIIVPLLLFWWLFFIDVQYFIDRKVFIFCMRYSILHLVPIYLWTLSRVYIVIYVVLFLLRRIYRYIIYLNIDKVVKVTLHGYGFESRQRLDSFMWGSYRANLRNIGGSSRSCLK
jgi:hypothetical protein